MNAVAYVRCSTEEQGETGASLQAQEQAVREACTVRGWTLTGLHRDVLSGKDTNRPGLVAALAELAPGSALVVAKLDRLTRSVADLGVMLERSRKEGWSLVALDLGVDTSTPAGELVANVMCAVAQWERKAIGQRTKDALAVRRAMAARGESWVKRDGTVATRVGRPPSMSPEVHARAAAMLRDGKTRREVAALLNAEGVPTPLGGRLWRASSLEAVKA